MTLFSFIKRHLNHVRFNRSQSQDMILVTLLTFNFTKMLIKTINFILSNWQSYGSASFIHNPIRKRSRVQGLCEFLAGFHSTTAWVYIRLFIHYPIGLFMWSEWYFKWWPVIFSCEGDSTYTLMFLQYICWSKHWVKWVFPGKNVLANRKWWDLVWISQLAASTVVCEELGRWHEYQMAAMMEHAKRSATCTKANLVTTQYR